MDTTVIIALLAGLAVIMLLFGASFKPVKLLGQGVVKLLIGAIFLYFLNSFGGSLGLHVPINLITAGIAGFLGISGGAAWAAIGTWII